MESDDGSGDYDGRLLDEIVRELLANDHGKIRNIVSVTQNSGEVQVRVLRRTGTKREYIATYKKVQKLGLRKTGGFELHSGAELFPFKGQTVGGEDISKLVRVLKSNGYTILDTSVYFPLGPALGKSHYDPDNKPIAVVRKRRGSIDSLNFYAIEKMPAYVKINDSPNLVTLPQGRPESLPHGVSL